MKLARIPLIAWPGNGRRDFSNFLLSDKMVEGVYEITNKTWGRWEVETA
ncbi:hypothetical protein [Thermodesulforhabdus norvegica]|nr:hypothetical protein [Thermodesulforhabdus norvegica]